MSVTEVAAIACFYSNPCDRHKLAALLSIVNPERNSPFIHWVWENKTAIEACLSDAPATSLARRLVRQADLEGPVVMKCLSSLAEKH
jgi:hypothetical protein